MAKQQHSRKNERLKITSLSLFYVLNGKGKIRQGPCSVNGNGICTRMKFREGDLLGIAHRIYS